MITNNNRNVAMGCGSANVAASSELMNIWLEAFSLYSVSINTNKCSLLLYFNYLTFLLVYYCPVYNERFIKILRSFASTIV
jgi:hypothetical protein